MGLMPPYDPFVDPLLLWGVVRVLRCEPAAPTWRNPGVVTLVVEKTLRGQLPDQVVVLFGPPREAEQDRFYALRNATPEEATRHMAELDQRSIQVPDVGARVIVWLTRPSPPPTAPPGFTLGPPGEPVALPPGLSVAPTPPEGGFWDIPTLRQFAPNGLPMQQRWIDYSEAVERVVRQRLGVD